MRIEPGADPFLADGQEIVEVVGEERPSLTRCALQMIRVSESERADLVGADRVIPTVAKHPRELGRNVLVEIEARPHRRSKRSRPSSPAENP